MNTPTSRLLLRLNAEIAAATDPYIADCLLAERSCYFARQGIFSEAAAGIAMLRERYASRYDLTITVWINLSEGLLSHFTNLGANARDKVLRAHALSSSAGLDSLHALTAAWLAQMDFARLDANALSRHVSEALALADAKHHAARARASLVMAQALHVAQRWDLASPWYTRARLHAVAEGDDATVSALMHNMVCMRLDNLRQAILTGRGDAREAGSSLTGVNSSSHFDRLIGASSLDAIRPLLMARIHSLQNRPEDAIKLYEEHISAGVAAGFTRLESDLVSDLGWCRVQQGDFDGARENALAAENSLTREMQVDDRAATHSRLARIFCELGEVESANRHELLAAESWHEYTCLQERVVDLLSPITEFGSLGTKPQ
jgi:Tetratricopeptide repeat